MTAFLIFAVWSAILLFIFWRISKVRTTQPGKLIAISPEVERLLALDKDQKIKIVANA